MTNPSLPLEAQAKLKCELPCRRCHHCRALADPAKAVCSNCGAETCGYDPQDDRIEDALTEAMREHMARCTDPFFCVQAGVTGTKSGERGCGFWITKAAFSALSPLSHEPEIKRLQGIIERERTEANEWVNRIEAEIGKWEHLIDGRGSYEWDDDRYRAEFAEAIKAIRAAGGRMRKDCDAHSFVDCPRRSIEVAEARAGCVPEPLGKLREKIADEVNCALIAWGNEDNLHVTCEAICQEAADRILPLIGENKVVDRTKLLSAIQGEGFAEDDILRVFRVIRALGFSVTGDAAPGRSDEQPHAEPPCVQCREPLGSSKKCANCGLYRLSVKNERALVSGTSSKGQA